MAHEIEDRRKRRSSINKELLPRVAASKIGHEPYLVCPITGNRLVFNLHVNCDPDTISLQRPCRDSRLDQATLYKKKISEFAFGPVAIVYCGSFMTDETLDRSQVDRFILDEIDSIPHLEALLLLWNSRPKRWPQEEMARFLYIPEARATEVLYDLEQRKLAECIDNQYSYYANHSRDLLIEEVNKAYQKDLLRITSLIHSKASPSIREFARAFRLKKD